MNIPTNPIASFFGANLGSAEAGSALMGQVSQITDFQSMLAQFALPENSEIAQVLSPEELVALGALLQQDIGFKEQVESLQVVLKDLQQLEQALVAGEEIDSDEMETIMEGIQSLLASIMNVPHQNSPVPVEIPSVEEGRVAIPSTEEPKLDQNTNATLNANALEPSKQMFKIEGDVESPLLTPKESKEESQDTEIFEKDPSPVPVDDFALELQESGESLTLPQEIPAPVREQVQKIQQVLERIGKLSQPIKESSQPIDEPEVIEGVQTEEESHPLLTSIQNWLQKNTQSLQSPQESRPVAENKDLLQKANTQSENQKNPEEEEIVQQPSLLSKEITSLQDLAAKPSLRMSDKAEIPQAPLEVNAPASQAKALESVPAATSTTTLSPQQPSAPQRSQMAERYDEFQAVRQVSQKVQWMVRNGEGKAILRLDPPELGHIEIEVETKSGEMKIHMSVENESVKNTLEASAPQLRQSMEQHHVKIEKLEVQVEARLDAQGGQADPQKSRRSEHAQRQLRRGMKIAEVLVDIPQVDTGRRLGYNTMELIA